MRAIFYILISIASIQFANAQDSLFLRNDSIYLVRIVEINISQLKYKLFEFPDGFTYVISKDDVRRVVYETGVEKEFKYEGLVETKQLEVLPKPFAYKFGRNFIALNAIDFFSGQVTIWYEHRFLSEVVGVKVPLSFAISGKERATQAKSLGTGLGINFYPYRQGKKGFLIGMTYYVNIRKYSFNYYSNYYYKYRNSPNIYSGFSVNTGLYFLSGKHFKISTSFVMGTGGFVQPIYLFGIPFSIDVMAGYRF